MRKILILLICLFGTVMGLMPGGAQATWLSHESFTTVSGAGSQGDASVECRSTNDMVFADGTSWAAGAAAVQGSTAWNGGKQAPGAANLAFGWLVGSRVGALNDRYGPGNWTIANPTLTFQYTLYANNSIFAGGPGTFATYWVGNDSWIQGDTPPTNNPVYTTNATDLLAWSGSQALLASTYYTWTTPGYTGTYDDAKPSVWKTDKTGIKQSTLTVNLALTSELLNDILAASATGNEKVSLYLMSMSDTLGLCIFTGGSGDGFEHQPTLSFDVVSAAPVPIPPSMFLLASGLGGFAVLRRRTASRYFRNLLRSGK